MYEEKKGKEDGRSEPRPGRPRKVSDQFLKEYGFKVLSGRADSRKLAHTLTCFAEKECLKSTRELDFKYKTSAC